MGAKPLNIYIDGAENSGRRSLLSWLRYGSFMESFLKIELRLDYSTIKHNKTDSVCIKSISKISINIYDAIDIVIIDIAESICI